MMFINTKLYEYIVYLSLCMMHQFGVQKTLAVLSSKLYKIEQPACFPNVGSNTPKRRSWAILVGPNKM